MDVMQMLLAFTLLISPVWSFKMNRCYDEKELDEAANRKFQHHFLQQQPDPLPAAAAAEAAAAGPAPSCPVDLYRHRGTELSQRSVSPWRYVVKSLKNHFPPTYTEAECLCDGCILIHDKAPPTQSHDYVSVPVMQSRLFLQRAPCSDGTRYQLRPVSLEVAVGCTCARARH